MFRLLRALVQVIEGCCSGYWRLLFRLLEIVVQVTGDCCSGYWRLLFRLLEIVVQITRVNEFCYREMLFKLLRDVIHVIEGCYMASKLYGVNATIIIFVFVLYCCISYWRVVTFRY